MHIFDRVSKCKSKKGNAFLEFLLSPRKIEFTMLFITYLYIIYNVFNNNIIYNSQL